MGENWLNELALLHVPREVKLNADHIIDIFARKKLDYYFVKLHYQCTFIIITPQPKKYYEQLLKFLIQKEVSTVIQYVCMVTVRVFFTSRYFA